MIQQMPMLLRRELWEHKALYVTPFVVAALIVFGFILSFFVMVFTGSSFNAAVAALELTGAPASLAGGAALVGVPFGMLNLALVAVIFFYSIDALYAERQDRSILFWRSLPVTDTETVISKFLTAVIAAPVVTMLVMLVTQVILLALASIAILLGSGNPVELLLGPLPFVQTWVLFGYFLLAGSLWFAPVIAWFLFCSAFAKRSVLIWVFVPWIVLIMLEGIVLRQGTILNMIGHRFSAGVPAAFTAPSGFDISQVDDNELVELLTRGEVNVLELVAPVQFLTTPALWGGFAVAAALLAGAIYFRRFRT
ncbi:MAG: hypothetical protein AAF290_13215 [Pseudomonadota bacterium]